jgi:hypothetical protein
MTFLAWYRHFYKKWQGKSSFMSPNLTLSVLTLICRNKWIANVKCPDKKRRNGKKNKKHKSRKNQNINTKKPKTYIQKNPKHKYRKTQNIKTK